MVGQHNFGSRLRAQRERHGVTLASIADSTKIKRSLLEGLESGDVSQWPRGLFRRAYIRDYACAIGLPPEPLVLEFGQIFPEDGGEVRAGLEAAEPLRLTLAGDPDTGMRLVARRALCAALEMSVVVAFSGVVAVASGAPFWNVCAVAALVYYAVAAAVTGRSLDVRQLQALIPHGATIGTLPTETREEPVRLYTVAEPRGPRVPFVHVVGGEDFPQHHTASH